MVATRLSLFATALWWGSLSIVGFMVVPMLFAHLGSPAVAGNMAARLFSAQTWVALSCGLVLLMVLRSEWALPSANRSFVALFLIVFGMLLALLSEFAVAPRIVARDNLRLWHGVGTVLYALQWLSATVLLWRLGASSHTR